MSNHFLGFDLGHADTAIALVSGETRERFAAPANLEIQGQSIQPTALIRVSRDGKEELVIGGRAIREASKAENGQKAELRAAFKSRPKYLGEASRDISDFFRVALEETRFSPIPPEGWAGTAIAVGCPSSWSAEEDVKQYQELLREGLAGTEIEGAEVSVVPESRAALLQAIDNPNSPLTVEARSENILVIDIGSSTLDFSLIAPERKASPLLDAGLDLGASFFERRILEANLEREPKAQRFLEHNPHYRDLWLFYARRTKEEYFVAAPTDDREDVSGAPLQAYFTGGKRRSLEILTSGEGLKEARGAPYDRELHPSKELALDPLMLKGKSWEEVYEISLRALKDAIERRGTGYGRVLLAGGASRMPFTTTIAEEVFGRDGRVLQDPEPSHMVSRGLARWGRKRENVERFAVEARRLLKEKLPALIDQEFASLKAAMARGLADVIFDEFVVPVLDKWKAGGFRTGHDVRREIEQQYDAWLRSGEGSAFFVRTINMWWRDEVKHELDRELDRLHAAYDISQDIQLHFDRAIEPEIFEFSAREIELPFETVIQATIITLAYVVTLSVDMAMGGIPFFTGGLTAAVALGGRFTRNWISGLDVPAFARKLPDRLPGKDKLFSGQIKSRVEKQLQGSFDKARASILRQVEAAVSASIERQTKRARTLLMGSEDEQGR
ncbi:hypothetical protein HK107_00165 [Parvularcula sp. ZS-1/3]|uniref:Hsp70 family protein n=1 Tax=Parvularcula mediterranea TaxID=2732508 RepID=A0A7Y3RIJ4_9PROT|nr:hypothetical protein [Parvularcula mediterranea]NNU14734.1 hypothetical protein [Parvularcula mediterranea]